MIMNKNVKNVKHYSFLISLLDLLQPKCNPFTRNQTIENNPPIKSTLHHKVLLCK